MGQFVYEADCIGEKNFAPAFELDLTHDGVESSKKLILCKYVGA